jgi:2-(1,2-epoxy-1,2-dihydrophenyl)acetyl-CoA isomerase
MASEQLLVEVRDGVLYLTMNRPGKLNALTAEMTGAMIEALAGAAHDPAVGCVVLTGAGRGFCSGGDIGAMRARNSPAPGKDPPTVEQAVAALRCREEVSVLLHEIPKVTIAAVNGPAAGAGMSLALACDIRLAAESARFLTAFGRIGFSGDFGGTYSLSQVVGSAKARELYFLGDTLEAGEALRVGLVSRVYPQASFRDEVHALASRVANGPKVAYIYMKANLNAAQSQDLRALCDREAFGQVMTGRSEDHREAVVAFLEKRESRFKGR